MELTDSVDKLKGVGPALAAKFHRLGVDSIEDLLRYYPRRYQDYSEVTPIVNLRPGQVTVKGKFKQVRGRYARRGLHITEGVLSDSTSSVRVIWFNQPYRAEGINPLDEYFVSGNFELGRQRLQIMNPSAEKVSDFQAHTARIIPVYRESKDVKSTEIRRAIKAALQAKIAAVSHLPASIEQEYKLGTLQKSLTQVHFPESAKDVEAAKRRLGFEEIFELILAHLLIKQETNQEKALPVPFKQDLAKDFVKHLPFELTGSQRVTTWEAYQDIEKSKPMNRLVEGDVGSGKTVVAAMLAAMTIREGFQVAIMAPTEILARQHAKTFYDLLEPLGLAEKVSLLVGSMSAGQKKTAYAKIKSGEVKCIVGTHALIQDKVDMHSLALVVVDEQHRFGVEQRKKLLKKAGHMPHMLSMTATPIPRSLALTVYGDLDISILKDKPPGRQPAITKLVPPNHRLSRYKEVDEQLAKGHQAFVVCPLIDESAVVQAKSATQVHKELTKLLPKRKVGLLHGKMKAEDKQSIMQDFIDRKFDLLVSTTVIEVGVDVPNATTMLIEAPERFGLAQIHQLRGRIGRGSEQGYCYLLLSDDKTPSRRLRAIEQSNDGFKLAELDLEIRGPGAIYGQYQHGLLDLRMVNLTDTKLIAEARQAAGNIIKNDPDLLQYPLVKARIASLQKIVHLN
jgi:ATP-dependent DNA helicase RecG